MKQKFVSRRITIYLDESTAKILDYLNKKLGINSQSEIVRFALRYLYKEIELAEKLDRRVIKLIEV